MRTLLLLFLLGVAQLTTSCGSTDPGQGGDGQNSGDVLFSRADMMVDSSIEDGTVIDARDGESDLAVDSSATDDMADVQAPVDLVSDLSVSDTGTEDWDAMPWDVAPDWGAEDWGAEDWGSGDWDATSWDVAQDWGSGDWDTTPWDVSQDWGSMDWDATPDAPMEVWDLGGWDNGTDMSPETWDVGTDTAADGWDAMWDEGPDSIWDVSEGDCLNQCGDLNYDGLVTSEDLALLYEQAPIGTSIVVGEECWAQAGDINKNGFLTIADFYLLTALLSDVIQVGCVPCSAVCGDANNDGLVDVNDVQVLQSYILGQMSLDSCQYWAADVKGSPQVPGGPPVADGIVNVTDILGINAKIMNGDALHCSPVE